MEQQSETQATVKEQCRAVLSVWTERRSAEAVCREMGISNYVLKQWQERAMGGMIRALAPRAAPEENKPALAVVVRRLVERMAAQSEGQPPRLARRLAKVMETRPASAG
jgi:hypothetical protein